MTEPGGTVPENATWPRRVVAAFLDNAILAGVTWLALGTGIAQPTLAPGLAAPGDKGSLNDPLILVPICAVVVLLVVQGTTGWTPGKLVVGIRVVREDSTQPAGVWTTLVRWALHLLDAIFLIGYLRPVWHPKQQTFADSIVHTTVVQAVPDLARRPRIVLYSAAVVVCVLGIGYGYVPISGSATTEVTDSISCERETPTSALTGWNVALGGSVTSVQDRRLWTVRESRTALPGASLTWSSDPATRDVAYRVELDARPRTVQDGPVVSRSWDLGTGAGGSSETGSGTESGTGAAGGTFTHTRTVSSDLDRHAAQVETGDSDDALKDLGGDLVLDVRLLADGEVVAGCSGTMSYTGADQPDW